MIIKTSLLLFEMMLGLNVNINYYELIGRGKFS